MSKLQVFMRTLLIATPIMYGTVHAYIPVAQNPPIMDDTRTEVHRALLNDSPQTLRQLDSHTSANYMVTWMAVRQMTENRTAYKCARGGITFDPLACRS